MTIPWGYALWGTGEFDYATLREWLSPAKLKADTRGRPLKWDWEGFWIEALLEYASLAGLPDKQAGFESYMDSWFVKKTGGSPSESAIREKASKLYQAKKARK